MLDPNSCCPCMRSRIYAVTVYDLMRYLAVNGRPIASNYFALGSLMLQPLAASRLFSASWMSYSWKLTQAAGVIRVQSSVRIYNNAVELLKLCLRKWSVKLDCISIVRLSVRLRILLLAVVVLLSFVAHKQELAVYSGFALGYQGQFEVTVQISCCCA